MRNERAEIKNALAGFKSRPEEAKDRISELDIRVEKTPI